MLPQEGEHRGIEDLRFLPRDRVAGVVDHDPVVLIPNQTDPLSDSTDQSSDISR